MDAEVVIVGGGPVGLDLAIDLGREGVRTVLIERTKAPSPIPKGQNLTQRTMEHFHFWGIERAIRAARLVPKDYGIGGLVAYGNLMSGYQYDWLQREWVRPFYFTDNERLPQYQVEAVLRARAAELPSLDLVYGWQAQAVEDTGGGVRVTATQRETGEERVISARYAVGCDGSHSLVRRSAGIGQVLSDHDRLMVLIVFKSRALHTLLERFPGKSYYCVLNPDYKGYWLFFGRVDLGTTWFFHAPVPQGTTKDNYDFTALLTQAAGAEFDAVFEHIGFWDLRFAVAETYRRGNVFLAGDSAHSHPPYGGYGVNTGFEDAANLGWKLKAALRGWAGDGLLNSYSAERQPVFVSTARDFIGTAIETDREFLAAFDPARDRTAFEAEWSARQSGARGEVSGFEPNYEGSAVVIGSAAGAGPSALGGHAFTARPGHHLAPQILASGKNVFEELGDGFTLIAFAEQNKAARLFREAASAMRVPLTVVADASQEARTAYGAAFILVRPDQFVAWASDTLPDDARAILTRAIGG